MHRPPRSDNDRCTVLSTAHRAGRVDGEGINGFTDEARDCHEDC